MKCICCFKSMVNSRGHVGKTVILTTLFLDKPPRGSFPVLSVHSFDINWQLLFLNQCKKNGRRNIFMTKSISPNLQQRLCGHWDRSVHCLHPKWHCYRTQFKPQLNQTNSCVLLKTHNNTRYMAIENANVVDKWRSKTVTKNRFWL